MLNSVVKISLMSAEYFDYYTIILRGGRFFVHTLYTVSRESVAVYFWWQLTHVNLIFKKRTKHSNWPSELRTVWPPSLRERSENTSSGSTMSMSTWTYQHCTCSLLWKSDMVLPQLKCSPGSRWGTPQLRRKPYLTFSFNSTSCAFCYITN